MLKNTINNFYSKVLSGISSVVLRFNRVIVFSLIVRGIFVIKTLQRHGFLIYKTFFFTKRFEEDFFTYISNSIRDEIFLYKYLRQEFGCKNSLSVDITVSLKKKITNNDFEIFSPYPVE